MLFRSRVLPLEITCSMSMLNAELEALSMPLDVISNCNHSISGMMKASFRPKLWSPSSVKSEALRWRKCDNSAEGTAPDCTLGAPQERVMR